MHTFLPSKDPLIKYKTTSKSLNLISEISEQLPKLLLTGSVQNTINKLKNNDLSVDKVIANNDLR